MVPRSALGSVAANIGRRSQSSGRRHGLGGLPHASACAALPSGASGALKPAGAAPRQQVARIEGLYRRCMRIQSILSG